MNLLNLLEDESIRKSIDDFEAYVRARLKTFDNFPLKETNHFGHAAAIEVALYPGKRNPLLLYGKQVSEMNHLLHAIKNACAEEHGKLRVAYVPAARFVNRFCDCKQTDILLFEGIHQLNAEEQHAFLQVFNELYAKGKQMVITADRSPKDLAKDPGMIDKLLARLAWGLAIELR